MTTNDTRTGKQFGIQAAPFTEAIHIGELTKDRTRFKGEFHDASEQAIAAVAQFVEKHYDGAVLFTYEGGLKVSIKVGDQADEPARDAEPTTVSAESLEGEFEDIDYEAVDRVAAKHGLTRHQAFAGAQALHSYEESKRGISGQIVRGVEARHVEAAIKVIASVKNLGEPA